MTVHDFTPRTISQLGMLPLPEHDEDPGGTDHRIVFGHWETAPCSAADEAHVPDATVWSSLTDREGTYGQPRLFTVWGNREATQPYVANLTWPGSGQPCEHAVFIPDEPASQSLAA